MNDRILCEKNGIRQYFTRRSWEVLGTDKLGWVEVPVEPPTPKEVQQPTRQTTEAEAPQTTTRKPRKK